MTCFILPHLASSDLTLPQSTLLKFWLRTSEGGHCRIGVPVTSHAHCAPLCSHAEHLAPLREFIVVCGFFSISSSLCGITGGSA